MANPEIQPIYDRILEYCRTHPVPDYLLAQSEAYQRGLWRSYLPLAYTIPIDYTGTTVVDFGCKYGHILPLFLALGAKKAIGVEVVDDYIMAGRALFAHLHPDTIEIVESNEGHLPLQPATADVVLVNEVISHVNPMYIHNMFSEVARILKDGGFVLVSDGNSLACPGYFEKQLIPFYEAHENGPDGTKTDRDTVTRSFVNLRYDLICERFTEMPEKDAVYLARNTSGLFGAFFLRTIEAYAQTGVLTRRPYRRGVCPTNPTKGGAVLERGFYPEQIEMILRESGFDCERVTPPMPLRADSGKIGVSGLLKHACHILNYYKMRVSRLIGQNKDPNFQILGVKRF